MKIRTLLAAVAAVSAISGVANAGVVAQGSAGLFGANSNTAGGIALTTLLGGQNTSLISIVGASVNNIGNASVSTGATFTLKGAVSPSCVYFTGNANRTIDFGQIGIYASDAAGPTLAFDQAAPAAVAINTNLAGCNTTNRLTIAKASADGMRTDNTAAFDTNVFTNRLPYSVAASWTGVASDDTRTGQARSMNLSTDQQNRDTVEGAWKSPMALNIVIPAQSKSLVSGNYSDTLTLTLAVN